MFTLIFVLETVKGIEEAEKRIKSKDKIPSDQINTHEIKAAIFYSIVATQKGLQVCISL